MSPKSAWPRCARRPVSISARETAEEVALSILAELVQVRRGTGDVRGLARSGDARRRGARRPPSSPLVDDIVLLDPVCGMTVDRAHVRHLAEHDGVVYAFCSMGCRTSFIREPTAYVPSSVSSGD